MHTMHSKSLLTVFLSCVFTICSLPGCGCMSHVSLSNETDMQMLVDVSLPFPGYGVFRSHCQFSILLEPNQLWDSRQANNRDRVQLPTGQHDNLLVRIINLDEEGWPNEVYSIEIEDFASVRWSGRWENLLIHASDSNDGFLEVRKDNRQQWSTVQKGSR